MLNLSLFYKVLQSSEKHRFFSICIGGYLVFGASGTFRVPEGVRRVRVLVVGGGSGGLSSHGGGGGSGYVRVGEFDLIPGVPVPVIVGVGGEGSPYQTAQFGIHRQNSKAGGISSFGSYLSAAGGKGNYGVSWTATDGGSGGGDAPGCGPGTSGAGGRDGSNGSKPNPKYCGFGEGVGQGAFSPLLEGFTRNRFTPGAGGNGRSTFPPNEAAGGGGGGVLLNGSGPTAKGGHWSTGGSGGVGFGAGGGGGGCLRQYPFHYYGGGKGADGLVYIEW